MDMQNVSNLQIPEGTVRTIHDKDNRLIWGRLAYDTKYAGDTIQNGAPTPDTPIPVQTVTGEQTITITDGGSQSQTYEVNLGKNLLNGTWSTVYTSQGYPLPRSDYITINSSDNNNVAFTSTSINRGVESDYIKLPKNTMITVSFAGTLSNRFFITQYDSSKTRVSTLNTPSDVSTTTVTTTQEGYITVAFSNSTAGSFNIQNIQLEQGSTATTYAPYFTPIELCKIGNYQDYIYKSGDDWYLHKAVEKIIYDGEGEAWLKAGDGSMRAALSPDAARGSSSNNPIMSNQYVSRFSTSVNNSIFLSGGQSQLGIADNVNAVDYQTWKNWLNSNNLTVYYALGTPINTKITDTTLTAQLDPVHQWLTRYGYESTVSGNLPIIIDRANL